MASEAGSSALAVARAVRRRRRGRAAVAGVAAAVAGWAAATGWPAAVVAAGAGVAAVAAGGALAASGRVAGRWQRGAEGEQRTGALLDELLPRGWRVWHDLAVPGSRANVDHLVVGRTGVWVVDTKTTRAAIHAGWSVRFGDRPLDTSVTRWESAAVADRLRAAVGDQLRRPLVVRPVVAVHGRGLRRRGRRCGGVPVVPAAGLVPRLTKGRRRLARRDRRLLGDAVDAVLAPAGRPRP